MGPYRMFCDCPLVEFHCASSVIIRYRTRSGKVKTIILYPGTPVEAISTFIAKPGVILLLSSAQKPDSQSGNVILKLVVLQAMLAK